jgi:hypothetical protein
MEELRRERTQVSAERSNRSAIHPRPCNCARRYRIVQRPSHGNRPHSAPTARRADRQGGVLIGRIAARAPVGKLFIVEALGHSRGPFAGYRPDHRAGVRAGRNRSASCSGSGGRPRKVDPMMGDAREARWHGFKIRDFAGRAAAGHPVFPRQVRARPSSPFYVDKSCYVRRGSKGIVGGG